jgi:hypothetical protein
MMCPHKRGNVGGKVKGMGKGVVCLRGFFSAKEVWVNLVAASFLKWEMSKPRFSDENLARNGLVCWLRLDGIGLCSLAKKLKNILDEAIIDINKADYFYGKN